MIEKQRCGCNIEYFTNESENPYEAATANGYAF